jgi:hypothetical protein
MSETQTYLNRINYKLKKILYLFYGEKFFKRKKYDWSKYPKRFEIIQKIIDLKRYKSYLEIGCDKNQSFSSVTIEKRVGVDPVEGGSHKMTSDKFFSINKDLYDIIFIDGLHEYSQVIRDIKNSLNCLSMNGVIVLHDCLPRNIWNQITPRINSDWNGDVWKAIVECRTFDYIDTYTCVADQGMGIILPRKNRNNFELKTTNFKKLKYKDYFNQHDDFMNPIDYLDLLKVIS